MKSPQALTLIVALIFSVAIYLLASSNMFELTSISVAAIAFVCAFVAPLIGKSAQNSNDSDSNVTTLYVGNLPYRANEAAVRELFSAYGQVQSVRLMKDKHTGKRRGFGFVEISASDADKAIASLNDSEFQQRTLKVREAKERPEPAAVSD
ncbi:RNA recognition motif. (a.k.a. RRM, RBD, or RNP domain) [Colwellia chukchiensis]|uniref:RNA recognition motif. (A.k.a. RRM, RBD, or RNP domain) n=1 Tax=Colwellia chukchiensis TaxID=641665 RepID=A0A1H7R824_9GAMM|nr:RNA-binding protein [Colwellia chukchiensis]SEL56436.1 RNA recognition motif. (a.k.a. RRM, RBD, or RNP domain) [Colwellia chukchiensis]